MLLVAGTALANGFSPADLQQAAKLTATDATAAQIARETEQLRLAIAFDPAAAIGMRSDAERPLLAAALGTGPGRGDAHARWFMAGAITQSVTPSTVTLYNPLARGWLTIGWRISASKPVVTSAQATSSGPVTWTENSGAYLAAFADDYAATRIATGTQPASIAVSEIDHWLTDLADWARPGLQQAAEAARQLIIEGRTARAGGGTADLLPANIRASFIPVAAFKRADGGRSLLFSSPLIPAMTIAADFDGAEAPTLKRLTFLNLAGDRS
jgi:hypothetical protein